MDVASLSRRSVMAGGLAAMAGGCAGPIGRRVRSRIWSHDNLVAWCAVPYDERRRGPEERAKMLRDLGFRRFAYDWQAQHVPSFDAEIVALKRNGIALHAWWFGVSVDDPVASAIVALLKRHGERPWLWVPQGYSPGMMRAIRKRLPADFPTSLVQLTAAHIAPWRQAADAAYRDAGSAYSPKTAREHAARVRMEGDRIAEMRELARPAGCRIALYNHNMWFGRMENQIAVLRELRRRGIDDVGIVYNFSHARDAEHDDTRDFERIWAMIQPHVVGVNVSGTHMEDGTALLPAQGDSELAMMRVIERSGWQGPVGITAESGGDAADTLVAARAGLDRLAAQIAA